MKAGLEQRQAEVTEGATSSDLGHQLDEIELLPKK